MHNLDIALLIALIILAALVGFIVLAGFAALIAAVLFALVIVFVTLVTLIVLVSHGCSPVKVICRRGSRQHHQSCTGSVRCIFGVSCVGINLL